MAATISLVVLAILGARQVSTINEQNSSIRIDRAGRTAAALLDAHVSGVEVFTGPEGSPQSIQISRAELEPSRDWDRLVDQIGRINEGAANVFRFDPETESFDRLSTTFRTPEGERVGGSQLEPGLISAGHPAYDTIVASEAFVGEVPVAGRLRLAYLTPLTDVDGSINGILAVDVGWVEDLALRNAQSSGRTNITVMFLLALVTLASIVLMFWSFRPLKQLSRFAHTLGTAEDPDSAILGLVDRDDEIGHLAQGLNKVRELRTTLEHQAFTDSLTQVPNRAALMRELEDRFAPRGSSDLDAGRFALFIMDLDGFKRVNDGLGHQAGDELLVQVATRLQATLAPGEFLARLGGDEFAVVGRPNAVGRESLLELAKRLADSASGSFQTGLGEAHVSASIGVAISGEHGRIIRDLMTNADLALYEVKRTGRGSVKIYEPRLAESFNRQLYLLPAFRRAIDNAEISVQYQPIYGSNGHVAAVEALARWIHPDEGPISPSEFVPIAEGTGLIDAMSWIIFEKTCEQITTWSQTSDRVPVVTVNVSSIQLRRPTFVPSIARLLEKYPAARGHFSLELTESFAVTDESGWHRPVLAKLQELGVYIAIDDFGTGYSTLSYLRDLNVDLLKIDQSFIAAAVDRDEHAALLAGIVSLGRGLGLRVVLEGIETEEQLRVVSKTAFDGLQGYLLGRPMSGDAVAELFGKRHPLLAKPALI